LKQTKRKNLSAQDYISGIKKRDRTILGRAITLIESNIDEHQELAQQVLTEILPDTGNSIRIGISGVPGAGKSTLIEAFGLYLIEKSHKVAVLAVDPTSSITGGSILGDKTRMEQLARHPECFIRPSPTSGALGGVARKTRESILICEAAGFDVIIVETVGVGQSEIAVRGMVDFFLLLQIAGSGDELQGIKRGIIEITDAIYINKADGENKAKAEVAKKDFAIALHYMKPYTKGWTPEVATCSALTCEGINELWQTIERFKDVTTQNDALQERRQQQAKDWMYFIVNEYLQTLFLKNPEVNKMLPELEQAVVSGEMPATVAAQRLVDILKFRITN
jgi:LAO/AO transport system kinase